MHNLLVQCLIALISKEFSPEEFRELLQETKGIPFAEMKPYWEVTNQIDPARESLRARFNHPTPPRYNQREVVKDVVAHDARTQAVMPEDETPEDWQPRPMLKGKMDFS